MTTDDRTPGRNYPLPAADNKLKDDVLRLRSALTGIDGDITALLLQMGLKAAIDHNHAIEDVTGLRQELDSKLTADGFSLDLDNLADVNVAGATNLQVVMRVGAMWAPVSLQVNHVSGLEENLNALAADTAARWNTAAVAGAANKATPADSDVIPLVDSVLKKLTFANLKAALKTVFDALYATVGHLHDDRYSVLSHTHDSRYYTEAETNSLLAGNMSGRAYPRRSDGTSINLIWSGQGGTPTWALGSPDGVNFYPYTPGNMSVAYASNAGAVGGWSQATIANQIEERAQAWANTRQAAPYTGSNSSETSFPVGTILLVCGAYPARNAIVTFGLSTQIDKYFVGGSGVAGTWRARGAAWSFDYFLAQRVA